MNNLRDLYQYEWKKLLSKKIARVSILLCMVTVIISQFFPFWGDYYIDGEFIDTNYNMYQTDIAYARELSGRKIDQKLLEETINAYRKIPDVSSQGRHYTGTKEYQQGAKRYSEIFSFIRKTTGMQTAEVMYLWEPGEEDLYAKRQVWLMGVWEELGLSQGEMDFWKKREAQMETPYVYRAHHGYSVLISNYQTVGLLVLMLIAICLSGMFSDEHTRKTDQIILCSPLGKNRLYQAKIMTGISFAIILTLLFFLFDFMITLCIYGPDGFKAAFQLIYAMDSDPITCGQAIMIAYGNMVAAAIIISIFVMILSELLHSSIATLSIMTGLLIIAMIVYVPEQYRVLSQIWNWLPWCFLSPWNVFGQYTLSLFGHYLTPWQAAPMIYLISGAILTGIEKPIYQRFQISGR